MRLTIVKQDNVVIIDGVGKNVDCMDLPPNFHALQWNGSEGHIEFVNNTQPSQKVTSLKDFQVYIDRWNKTKVTPTLADPELLKQGLAELAAIANNVVQPK